MGKRELLLICIFATIGTIAYYATAPAAAPGQQRFSFARMVEELRREIHGNRSSAEVTTTTVIPVKPGVTEVRFEMGNAPISITGEDRTDLLCELKAWSSGHDESEAKRYAAETVLKTSEVGASVVIGVDYPEPATQRATLVVRMPAAMAVRVQPSRGKLDISDVASVELVEARGQAVVRRVDGRVTVTHRGGALTVETVSVLKLNTRGSTVVLKDIKGEAMMQVQAGELRGQLLSGPIEIESNGTRITLDDLTRTRRPIRINAIGGSVTLAGVESDTRIDGRDTRIDVTVAKPAPIAIYNEAEESMEVTLPNAGVQLDALATDGRLTVPEGLEVKVHEDEQRVTGAINGGGPTITLRASRGDITVKKQADK